MNPLSDIKKMYFLGIGGIGMSALARYFHQRGIQIYGYDKTKSPLTSHLEEEGMIIHFEDNPQLIPQNIDLVVYTPAIPDSQLEYIYFQEHKIPCIKRSKMLGLISENKETYAIAGTHGKTSTTAILTQIMYKNKPISAFIGGIANNFNSNYIDEPKSSTLIVEADEFDRSFLSLHPKIAVITSMDADHLDIYGTHTELKQAFKEFASQIDKNGFLISKKELLAQLKPNCSKISYSFDDDSCDYYAKNLHIDNGKQCFEIVFPNNRSISVAFAVAGKHNVENAVAAAAVADLAGIAPEIIAKHLNQYIGVKRRFEYVIKRDDFIYIDDYAHHPKELESTILSARLMHPNKHICGVFQPHLYTRTRDFADDFAKTLDLLDSIILLDIYPAREELIQGIDAQFLLNKMHNPNKMILSKELLPDFLKKHRPEVLLTMGAGDIDRLVNIIKEKFCYE